MCLGRWERLFVDEMEVDKEELAQGGGGGLPLEHPYLGALKGVEEVEQLLLARARRGEDVLPLLVHQLLPQPEDAALVDLRLAEEDERVRDAREAQAQAAVKDEAEGGESPQGLGGELEESEGPAPGGGVGVPGAAPGTTGPTQLTRFEAMRERLQAQHDRRAAEEAAALSRDVAM